MAGWFTAAGSDGATPKRMKLMEDLAEKRASSGKRSHELTTKLAEQRDDAVRQLEEEWHQHAQSHPESSKPPEAPQLPQPSHELDEAAASLYPFLQRRLEEFKAEAAKREEMLAGLDKYLFKYIFKGADSASAAIYALRRIPDHLGHFQDYRYLSAEAFWRLEEVHVLQRDMISALECQLRERELELERRTIECRAIERRADELERRLQGRDALKTAPESLEINGIAVSATGPIHCATADVTATAIATAAANGVTAANGATAAKVATAANAAETSEDEWAERWRIDKLRTLHGHCPLWEWS